MIVEGGHRATRTHLIGVSMPRTGHHFLARLLGAVLGDDLFYCNFYGNVDCCRVVPCTGGASRPITFQKNHDLDLSLPRDETGGLYLIQHRAPVPMILSAREVYAQSRDHVSMGEAIASDRAEYAVWLARQADYYLAFHQRWLEEPPINSLVIDYDELASHPDRVLARLLDRAGVEVDQAAIREAVGITSPRAGARAQFEYRPRTIEESRFMDRELIPIYESMIVEALPALAADRLFAPVAYRDTVTGRVFEARRLWRRGDVGAALAVVEQALVQAHDNGLLLHEHALLLQAAGRHHEAHAALVKAATLPPAHPAILQALVSASATIGDGATERWAADAIVASLGEERAAQLSSTLTWTDGNYPAETSASDRASDRGVPGDAPDVGSEPGVKAEQRSLRVLIATAWLGDRRGGTELYALQVATELLRRGHRPVIFSPALGSTADEARAAGIEVVDRLTEIAEAPDVIHGQHQVETATALLHFPGTPAVSFCLSARFWSEIPLRHPRVRRYVACDRPTYERITLEYGVDPSRAEMILNFVDLEKFRERPPLPTRPGRALVFSNYASEHSHVPAVRAACEQRGIAVDVVGAGAGQQSRHPEELLGQYDLVFAKARAAIEALAVGAAVIVCDFDGVGPMVSTANVEELRELNFGYRVQTEPHRPDLLLEQIDRYDPDDARAVSARIRATAGLDQAVDAIERTYRLALAASSPVPWEVEMRAAAEYVHWLSPYLREREQALGWAERLLEIAEERNQRIEELTAETDRQRSWGEGLLATAEERGRLIEELKAEVDRRTDWAEGLLATAEERGRLIDELAEELGKRTAWAEGLLATAEERARVIEALERRIRELDERAKR